jgi:hypothetical protein
VFPATPRANARPGGGSEPGSGTRADKRPSVGSRPRIRAWERPLPSTGARQGCRRPTASATAGIRLGEKRAAHGARGREARGGGGRAGAGGARGREAGGPRRQEIEGPAPASRRDIGDSGRLGDSGIWEIEGRERRVRPGSGHCGRDPDTVGLCGRVRLVPRDSGPLRDARRPVPAHRRLPAFGATHASPNHAERRPAAHRASLR